MFFSEQEILREEIASLQSVKDKLKKRVSDLEDDLKKSKEELEKEKKKGGSQDETDVRNSDTEKCQCPSCPS